MMNAVRSIQCKYFRPKPTLTDNIDNFPLEMQLYPQPSQHVSQASLFIPPSSSLLTNRMQHDILVFSVCLTSRFYCQCSYTYVFKFMPGSSITMVNTVPASIETIAFTAKINILEALSSGFLHLSCSTLQWPICENSRECGSIKPCVITHGRFSSRS